MSQIPGAEFVYETTATAVEEKKKLRRNFRRFDVFFYLICTLVTLDTIGAVAANGAQGFTWLIFLGIFFFLPYGLSIAELGSAFPQEGGPYVWSRLAFGRKIAPSTRSSTGSPTRSGWAGRSRSCRSPRSRSSSGTCPAAFIWFTITAAIVSLQYGKWVPTAGAWARGLIITFFAITVIVYAAKHGVHGFGGHAFSPTYAIFIAVVPVLFFNYAGLEVPSAAGEEMVNPRRDVPFAVLWSGAGVMVAYGLPILLILIVLPPSAVSGLTGFLDAIKAVFTVYGAAGDRGADLARVGVNWFGAGGNPNDSLAALSFSHERLEYELSQIIPLLVIVLIGVVFYFLGTSTRRQEVTAPVEAALAGVDGTAGPATDVEAPVKDADPTA